MYQRQVSRQIAARLLEPRHTIQVLQGPRQTGKTTAIKQALQSLPFPFIYESLDSPYSGEWRAVEDAWERARALHRETTGPVVLVLDEIQKLPRWTEVVKGLWDEDTWHSRDVRVALLGSSPILLGRGLRESMAGRYEKVLATHWTWPECRDAFGWTLDQYVYFGGYPGVAPLIESEDRWRMYVTEVALESTIARDVLHMSRIDKPALMRRLAYLGAEYSGRELSYRKMLGQLDDVGNTTTIAHYLDLLEASGLVSGLQKWANQPVRRRASTPKLLVHNTGLMSAVRPLTFEEARADTAWWGRLVETCVGAHLLTQAKVTPRDGLHYWRERGDEVDFVLQTGRRILAIEVKSSPSGDARRGIEVFRRRFGSDVAGVVIGPDGIELREFLEADLVTL